MIKKIPKLIDVTERPVIIVGEKPGKTRVPCQYALVGNRTGDFVAEAIEGLPNIILTNVVNILYEGNFNGLGLREGLTDLHELINTYKPRKIICLGSVAKKYVKAPAGCMVSYMPHPSYINRFKSSERSHYIKHLRHETTR